MDLFEHPLLAHLSTEHKDTFSALAERETYSVGEEMVHEGDLGDSLFMILSGEAEVLKRSVKDDPNAYLVRLALLGPGEFFGEMSLVEPNPRSATVRALAATEVARLSNATLQRALESDPRLMNSVLVGIIKGMSVRLRVTSSLVVNLKRNLDALSSFPTAI
ncbi:MAG TPA: cyclic nucleotide-binding domain-containing protein [Myxococcota bacterium]|jgi:CRP/FNR family cyclic AMP-dependent transcriptional regulator|nr:cyclic nucleotide-binding domain-containing protein [Myxococcota bacterium]